MVLRILAVLMLLFLAACQTGSPDRQSESKVSRDNADSYISLMEKDQARGEAIDRKEIEKYFSGKAVHGVSREKELVEFEYSKWGHKNDLLASYEPIDGSSSKKDRGTWWQAQDLLCQNLQNKVGPNPQCYSVHRSGSDFVLIDKQGLQAFRMQAKLTTQAEARQKSKTINKSSKDSSEDSREKAIGKIVAYSELCAQYLGSGASNKQILGLKNYYSSNEEFSKGYEEYADNTGWGYVTGLTQCEEVKTAIEKVHKSLVK